MRIAINAFEGVTMFHLAVPQMVFGEVTRLGLAEDWATVLWSTDTDTITTAAGNPLGGLARPEAAAEADMVVIPSWPYPPVTVAESLRTVLIRAHARGAGVVGLCMGAFAVAEAGLMNGRLAVTHWQAMQERATRHPELAVDDSVLYIDHDDVMTSAGTASSLDACLHLVRKHLGAAAANRVARSLVVAPHREGGQAQYIERPVARPDSGDPLAATLEWAMARLHEPLSIDDLADHARMSRRTFVRRFRDSTGTTPARWVLARRLDEARSLLETTPWGVDRIALTCGFGSAVTLRQNFIATYATTPSAYRRSFALKEPAPPHQAAAGASPPGSPAPGQRVVIGEKVDGAGVRPAGMAQGHEHDLVDVGAGVEGFEGGGHPDAHERVRLGQDLGGPEALPVEPERGGDVRVAEPQRERVRAPEPLAPTPASRSEPDRCDRCRR